MKKNITIILLLFLLISIFLFLFKKKQIYLEKNLYIYIPFSIKKKDNNIETYIEGSYNIKNNKIKTYNYYYTIGYDIDDIYFIVKNEINSSINNKYVKDLISYGKECIKNNKYSFKFKNQNYKIINYYQFSYDLGLKIENPHPNTLEFKKETINNFITNFKVKKIKNDDYKLLFKSYNNNSKIFLKGLEVKSFMVNNKEYTINDLETLKINSDLFSLCFSLWNELKGKNSERIYISNDNFYDLNIAKYKNNYISFVKNKSEKSIDYFYHLFSSNKNLDEILYEDLELEFKKSRN